MFERIFAQNGLSLDRLRVLLEVGAAGSIVKAAAGDPVRQSQYSRQIKELEDYFQTRLILREGKGTRLTAQGKELARISRFFMLGLSNFRCGCLAAEQTFRIGATATFTQKFLLPTLAREVGSKNSTRYTTEITRDDEVERRLHDLSLDFGVVTRHTLSRPLQTRRLVEWTLQLWVPRSLGLNHPDCEKAFQLQQLPLALARSEVEPPAALSDYEPVLNCENFLEAREAMQGGAVAALLPSFLITDPSFSKSAMRVRVPGLDSLPFEFHLAWNPRLLRLNPHATRQREWLANALKKSV